MPADPLHAGLDIGTSGARACLVDADGRTQAEGRAAMSDHGDRREPETWWSAAQSALAQALAQVDRARVRALAVDGTSGTMLPVDAAGRPLASASMYDDPCGDPAVLAAVARHAPPESAAHGATSGLARALTFQSVLGVAKVLHQADWIAFRLSGLMATDENNALKTGYDPVAARWPAWIASAGLDMALLPEVHRPGAPLGRVHAHILPDCRLVAGTTDGCASFLATGAAGAGEGVTALGTTLTLKILSDRPIFAPAFGVYSHRVLGMWLAGGASNVGGAALLRHFTPERIAALSAGMDPTPSPLDYYPLPKPGERFPVADPALPPRIDPRPDDDAAFLKGLLDGIARVEAQGYARLAELGAPPLASVRTVGGGARNAAWTALRRNRLRVPFLPAAGDEAAAGAARLARLGAAA